MAQIKHYGFGARRPRERRQITMSPPLRTDKGFGCPACGTSLKNLTRREVVRGFACCGYTPEGEEASRLLAAIRLKGD